MQQTDTVIERILPLNNDSAVRFLIDISTKLCELSDTEHAKLMDDDFVGVALLQDQKKSLADKYEMASKEFRIRFEEFRQASPSLLGRLEKLQVTLGDKARENAVILEKLVEKLQQNTHSTLLNAQCIAQESR